MTMEKNKNDICKDARKIQDILTKGYHLDIWPNIYGEDCFWLVDNDTSEKVYISHKPLR